MPDRNILESYIDACRLIEETEKDLARLSRATEEILHDSVSGSNPEFPYEQRVFHIEGIGMQVTSSELQALRKTLKERKEAAKKLRLGVESWVNTTPMRIQRIVRLKYFEHETWSSVSRQLGYSSPHAARMELYRYLKGGRDNGAVQISEGRTKP